VLVVGMPRDLLFSAKAWWWGRGWLDVGLFDRGPERDCGALPDGCALC
jgi:hypothetical protein